MLRRIGFMPSWRAVVTGAVLVACASLVWPGDSFGRPRALDGAKPHGGSHLYVLLGFWNMSPGLREFGAKMEQRGIPTTVRNFDDWPELAQEAIAQYKSGRLRSIYIVGHSLGGAAAKDMAAELGRAGVPVQSLVTLAGVGDAKVSSNVRHSVALLPGKGEGHFSIIVQHERELTDAVLGRKSVRDPNPKARRGDTATQPDKKFANRSNN